MDADLHPERGMFLHRLNPVAKLLVFSCFILAATLYLDVAVPLTFLVLAWLMGWLGARISPFALLRRLSPVLAAAVGLTVFNTLFYGGPREHLILTLGPLSIWREGLQIGGSIGLRILCVASYSVLYMWTTEPSRLVASLMQQARMPYRLAYAVLAAYRFLPILQRELGHIQAAQQVRSAHRRQRGSWLRRITHYGIPLLVSGIRQAERLAIAMDARGFGALPTRTHYVRTHMRPLDYIFTATGLAACALVLFALGELGLLRSFLAGVAESLAGAPQ
ncbi:MAG: energy-coupling factor transporter transmembrane protein EcfT [Anaerolineae bacterium]|nr:energy-coupling factor transporter transmembrane protein EcfT [Anaerolineae bacterium]MDW8071638.1 energy-coupling factor transporter transmembrane component T [Anaerolineae bacterium]